MIDLLSITSQLPFSLLADSSVVVELPEVSGGALHVKVDGPCAVTSLCLWQRGICEVTRIVVETGNPVVEEYQFSSESEAVSILTAQAQEALHLANGWGAPNNSFKPTPLCGAA